MAPPDTGEPAFEQIASFDDEALRTFLDPHDGGIPPADLAVALEDSDAAFRNRVAAAVPESGRAPLDRAQRTHSARAVAAARRRIVDRLFWPLLYWNDPAAYEELVAGEHIHPGLIDMLELDDRVVCDIGAGAGRFALLAATRAQHVIAVDAIPALLARLEEKARDRGLRNVDVRRGSFAALPLADSSVDVAVACSSLTSQGPLGGERALAEAERIVRPGGDVVVIWPQETRWFREHGYSYVSLQGNEVIHFPDVATAERVCRRFYSARAAAWVRRHHSADVPYHVAGLTPPNDACIKRVA